MSEFTLDRWKLILLQHRLFFQLPSSWFCFCWESWISFDLPPRAQNQTSHAVGGAEVPPARRHCGFKPQRRLCVLQGNNNTTFPRSLVRTHFLARDLRLYCLYCLFTSSHNICVCEESHPQTHLGLRKIDLRDYSRIKRGRNKKTWSNIDFPLLLWDVITFGLISLDLFRETHTARSHQGALLLLFHFRISVRFFSRHAVTVRIVTDKSRETESNNNHNNHNIHIQFNNLDLNGAFLSAGQIHLHYWWWNTAALTGGGVAASQQPFPPPTKHSVTFTHKAKWAVKCPARGHGGRGWNLRPPPRGWQVTSLTEHDCAGWLFLLRRTGGAIGRVAGRRSGRRQWAGRTRPSQRESNRLEENFSFSIHNGAVM